MTLENVTLGNDWIFQFVKNPLLYNVCCVVCMYEVYDGTVRLA